MSAELNLNVLSSAQAYSAAAGSALGASQELVEQTNGQEGGNLFADASSEQSGASQATSTAADIEARGAEASADKSENEAQQSESESVIDKIFNALNGVKDALLGVNTELSSTRAAIEQNQTNKNTIDEQIGALGEDDSDEAQAQKAALQQQSEAIQAEINEQNQVKEQLEEEQGTLEAEEGQLTTQKTNEENNLANLQAQGAEIDGEIAEIQTEGESQTSANLGGEQDANQTETEAQQALAHAQSNPEEGAEVAPAADQAHGETVEQSVPIETPAEVPAAPAEQEPVNLSQTVQNMEQTAPQAPVEQAPVVEQAPAENTTTEDKTSNNPFRNDDNSIEAVKERIENNEVTDGLMADVIIKDFFMGEMLEIASDEIIGLKAEDAIERASESFQAKTYSNTVYSQEVSENTDTASFDENQEAISNLNTAYNEASDKVNAPGVEFLSLTDKSNFENVSKVVERLNDGEYILTREIDKTTQTAESIQVSAVETKNTEDEASKVKGADLLKQLKGEIIEDAEAPEDENDDILTQKEYDEMENFFYDNEDTTKAYEQMIEDAKKFGIYATAA